MVASRQVEIPFYRDFGRQRGRSFSALNQVIGKTESPFLRKCVVQAAKHVGADLLEFAVPEIAVVSGRKNFRTAAESMGRRTLRKHVGNGSRKRSASKIIPRKAANQTNRSRRDIFTNLSP